jgi:hypothetical protein
MTYNCALSVDFRALLAVCFADDGGGEEAYESEGEGEGLHVVGGGFVGMDEVESLLRGLWAGVIDCGYGDVL